MTDFFPVVGRVATQHYTASVFDRKSQNLAEISSQESPIPPILQLLRLKTQEKVHPFFHLRDESDEEIAHLQPKRFSSWNEVQSSRLFGLAKKTAEAERKTFLRSLKEERFNDYLQECWGSLKDQFQEFYLKLIRQKAP